MEHQKRFTVQKIENRLRLIEPMILRHTKAIEPFRYFAHSGDGQADRIEVDCDDSGWPQIHPNNYWGGWNTNFTLRSRFSAPMEWGAAMPIVVHLKIGTPPNWDFCHPEALVYIDGQAIAGLDHYHTMISIPPHYLDGKQHVLSLDGFTGRWCHYDTPPALQLFMGDCCVGQVDTAARAFVGLVRFCLGAVHVLPQTDPARDRLLNALDEAFLGLDLREPLGAGFYAGVGRASQTLRHEIHQAGPSLDVAVTAIGHTHIDVAWVWPLAQTRKKCGRSFHTVLALMEEYPDYLFTMSQPQLYDFVRQDYPQLFQQIKEKVKQGRWEPVGGMWLEADCNITGPESLVRQFLLGRQFFREHFGKDAESPILWLPDVFGYTYSLPQIMKLAGMEYFFTTKLSWNQYNKLPCDSFWWQGLDGTRIMTHTGTTTCKAGDAEWVTYGGQATPQEFLNTWTNCKQKESHRELMTCFGFGDGGGGPTREMLDNIRIAGDFPSFPKVHHGKAFDFFRKLEQTTRGKLPIWNGELYMENHRGTFTSQARNKKANRRAEFALHDAEWLACMAAQMDSGFAYPHGELKTAWQWVCLNQFHDIIPGSSIGQVYDESLAQYEQVYRITDTIKISALESLSAKTGGDLVIANPCGFDVCEPVFWTDTLRDGHALTTRDGKAVLTQQTLSGTLIDAGVVESYSIKTLTMTQCKGCQPQNILTVSRSLLENALIRVELNTGGDIIRIYDKVRQRDVLSKGCIGNQLMAFEDRPTDWDAWNIDIFFEDKMWLCEPAESIEVVESGPIRAMLEIRRRILNSSFVQRLSIFHNSPRLDIDTTIEWNERHILLKAAFPVDILANEATYEIQWGNIRRPTHQNTSWDWARFECCAQKWIDLSEGDYGVSLINDCKYGHDVKENVMRITLLRSPTIPDPNADRGTHSFRYCLLPHQGTWGTETLRQAYAVNDPPMIYPSSNKQGFKSNDINSFVKVDQDNIVIETVKQAEDGSGVIVRLYESGCRRGSVELTARFNVRECFITDLLENNQQRLETGDRSVKFDIKPYQILTLRLIS